VGVYSDFNIAYIYRPFIHVADADLTITDSSFENLLVGDCSVVEWSAGS
jgi:hypothetical protein